MAQEIMISNADDYVSFNTDFKNGVFNPVWEIEVPELLEFFLLRGALLKLKLINSTNQEPDPNTRLVIGARAPGDSQSRHIVQPFFYRRWRNLSEAEQQDDTKNTGLRLKFPGQGVRVPQLHVITLEAETISGSTFAPSSANSFFELTVIQRQTGRV